jgi:uncharacterized iron-regulated membrane protein
VDWKIGRGFSTTLGYTWANSVYQSNPTDPASVGQQLIDVPRNLVSAALTYEDPRDELASVGEEQMSSPSSRPPHGSSQPIGIDVALARFHDLGVQAGPSTTLPEGPEAPYMANWRPDRAEEARVVYLDQYTAALLGDVGFKDFGPVAKSIEWGIAVHQGQEFGPINRYVMLLGCVAIVLLAVAAVTMWWKRRPAGTLGGPPAPDFPGAGKGFVSSPSASYSPLSGFPLLLPCYPTHLRAG